MSVRQRGKRLARRLNVERYLCEQGLRDCQDRAATGDCGHR